MKVFTILFPILCQGAVFKPYAQRVMVNSHAFTAMANKIDSLKIRQKCIRFHLACEAGFETADRCYKFYSMMAELYERHIRE